MKQSPSTVVRVIATWLVIFPSVATGQVLIGPFVTRWPWLAQTMLLTVVVVPFAVCVGVPSMLRATGALTRRWARSGSHLAGPPSMLHHHRRFAWRR